MILFILVMVDEFCFLFYKLNENYYLFYIYY